MEIEKRQTDVRNSNQEKLAAPLNFGSPTSFTLKRVKVEKTPMDTKLVTSLVNRPWILYDQEIGGIKESDYEQIETKSDIKVEEENKMKSCVDCGNTKTPRWRNGPAGPKSLCNACAMKSRKRRASGSGVTKSSTEVTAKLHMEEACSTLLEGAPVFTPTEEEFEDTLKYIASIRSQAEPYGICRIIPPDSWHPPRNPMRDNCRKGLKFTAHVQRIQSLNSNQKFEEEQENIKRKRSKTNHHETAPCRELERSEEFTIRTFKIYNDEFKEHIFRSEGKYSIFDEKICKGEDLRHWDPNVKRLERAYGRIVKDPSGEIKDIYHADLESGILESGFQSGLTSTEKSEYFKHGETGWNLNNMSKLPGSLLAFESSKTSNCLLPRLSLGMCFSSHCWKVEDHHLYSLHYMHYLHPKVWYCIPGRYYAKFETTMKKYFPNLGVETSDLLQEMVTQLTPSVLKLEGIPVYRCVQTGGSFVLIFPGAYHSGFNCGFNVSEKACFASIDWLPHGQNIVELYGKIGKKTSISHDKLLFGTATKALRAQWEIAMFKDRSEDNLRWAAFCGKDGMLAKALESRIKQEASRRKYHCKSSLIQKMEMDFDSTVKRECKVCSYDLHLSASSCPCSPDRYTCLLHTSRLCTSCPWSSRVFLFRHTISDLKVLLEAVEGDMSSLDNWVKANLRPALRI